MSTCGATGRVTGMTGTCMGSNVNDAKEPSVVYTVNMLKTQQSSLI